MSRFFSAIVKGLVTGMRIYNSPQKNALRLQSVFSSYYTTRNSFWAAQSSRIIAGCRFLNG